MAEPPSSPPTESASAEDALAWYKSQYEQLEHELSEFRASSHELEQELEKDLEVADKRQRAMEEKTEALSYEVEEWKRKYKDSKAEANAAQNTLEKEITTLRDSNRTLQLRLRDIEVANDDFERQARRTVSSLEDMESKYSVAIERAVLLEEEVKSGEQERERLRIDAQRQRDELSDLKVETEILQDKIKKYESARHHLSAISTDISVPESPTFDHSPNSTASSPLITTPPEMTKGSGGVGDDASVATATSTPSRRAALGGMTDPPSPPMSDTSMPLAKAAANAALPQPRSIATVAKTPIPASAARKTRLPSADQSVTPKPPPSSRHNFTSSTSSNASVSGRPRVATATGLRTPSAKATAPPSSAAAASRTRASSHRGPGAHHPGSTAPTSNSLAHVRTLAAQVQRIEARMQAVRSKLPGPGATPAGGTAYGTPAFGAAVRKGPRYSSPHGGSNAGPDGGATVSVPSSVTIRSRKRTVGSAASSVSGGPTATGSAGSATGNNNSNNNNNNPLGDDTTPTSIHHYNAALAATPSAAPRTNTSSHVPRLSTSAVSRLSFGPLPNRGGHPDDSAGGYSRPSSRASITSGSALGFHPRPASRNDNNNNNAGSMIPPPRPLSRASLSGARTPQLRTRSSLSGSLHGMSSIYAAQEEDEGGEAGDGVGAELRSPSRSGRYSRFENDGGGGGGAVGGGAGSAIPMPGGRRQSGVGVGAGVTSGIPAPGAGRRISSGLAGPKRTGPQPQQQQQQQQAFGDLGETY